MPMVIKVHYLYQSSSPKIPGREIPIRLRVDGNKFTTPLFSVELLAVLCGFTNVYFEKNFTFEVII